MNFIISGKELASYVGISALVIGSYFGLRGCPSNELSHMTGGVVESQTFDYAKERQREYEGKTIRYSGEKIRDLGDLILEG